MNTSPGPSLFDNTEIDSSHRRTFINPILWFDDCDGYRVVFCRHEVLYRVALADPLHLALVAVTLRQSQLATQAEIATAFGPSVATSTVVVRLAVGRAQGQLTRPAKVLVGHT